MASEGVSDRGGKNVVDFERDSIVNSLRKAVRLLPPGKRRLLFAAAAVQVSLGLLDLLGIALVGILAAYIPARRASRVDPYHALKEL